MSDERMRELGALLLSDEMAEERAALPKKKYGELLTEFRQLQRRREHKERFADMYGVSADHVPDEVLELDLDSGPQETETRPQPEFTRDFLQAFSERGQSIDPGQKFTLIDMAGRYGVQPRLLAYSLLQQSSPSPMGQQQGENGNE